MFYRFLFVNYMWLRASWIVMKGKTYITQFYLSMNFFISLEEKIIKNIIFVTPFGGYS